MRICLRGTFLGNYWLIFYKSLMFWNSRDSYLNTSSRSRYIPIASGSEDSISHWNFPASWL